MKRFYFTILYTLFLISLIGCQTVSKKIEDTTTKEAQELSKWLNNTEEDLKNFYGQPDKLEFLKTRNRNYVYITEKYKIKCERKFEVNPRNIVVGYSSKNCFQITKAKCAIDNAVGKNRCLPDKDASKQVIQESLSIEARCWIGHPG